ncbi:uncharacterized protein LOC114541065 [Dendronephthya gigantea]|uniref:uncharacterized protein LOC114541065 n=1 Tax=Dendronephthya gigantea TaxID=151771 RepID=UPI00106C2249|nr:uncharacterized protein LOC114541065 [Dendronephthya gigantea]
MMDSFLGDRPEAEGLENSIDSSGDALPSGSVSDISDAEDDLVQKYGEGKMIEKQCPECYEKFELRTAGTHTGNNNTLAVFCDDDQMVCPYCNYTEVDQDGENKESTSGIEKLTTPAPTNDKDGKTTTSSKRKWKKEKPSKMQDAFGNAIKEHTTCMQESDKKFLSEIREQAEKERELRKEELGTFKDAMALLASAVAGRAQPVSTTFPPYTFAT